MDNQSLSRLLYRFLDWHPARITTFVELILAIIKARTVKIKDLAIHTSFIGSVKAKIKRIGRLLFEQHIDMTAIGKLILGLLNIQEKVKIAIDRTNWQFGSKNLNFFVAAIVYGNISVPIAWLMLDKKGNSNFSERQKLIKRILSVIPKEKIELILADREFVGEKWLEYLSSNDLPFAVRVKKNERIEYKPGCRTQLSKYFRGMVPKTYRTIESKFYNMERSIKITCLQLEQEQLFVVSNVIIGSDALLAYKQRWSIERSFLSMKSSGFNIEDTHITDLRKLEKLFAIASIALSVCVIAGEIKNGFIPIKIKKHGRKLYSLFTYGFDWLKEYFAGSANQILQAFFELLRAKILGLG